MFIGLSSDDDEEEVEESVKLRGQINSRDKNRRKSGVQVMNSLMQPYKKVELRKIDIYLLQGIFSKDPEEIQI